MHTSSKIKQTHIATPIASILQHKVVNYIVIQYNTLEEHL